MKERDILRIEPWQIEAASTLVVWTGDLDDDCSAEWAGLVLRAEEMDSGSWWWALYDQRSGAIICDSNHAVARAENGKTAREAVEAAARAWLGCT